jgi:hypothetical protein
VSEYLAGLAGVAIVMSAVALFVVVPIARMFYNGEKAMTAARDALIVSNRQQMALLLDRKIHIDKLEKELMLAKAELAYYAGLVKSIEEGVLRLAAGEGL